MMFSMANGSDRSGAGTESEAGGGVPKASVPSDEVASAVAAVSDEIVDILKDEFGDADSADRIGAELADLGAELGLLAGLTDEPHHNFPSLFEIAIGHRGSGSASSSSSWSGGRGGRSRRPPRPQRAQRRRPIAKGKELLWRRSAAARRAASMRVRRIEVVSDASDVGADSDSDDQWTEFDDNSGTTDSSSGKDVDMVNIDCTGYQDKGSQVEAPAMGQFLLPLLSADAGPEPEHFLIRHEDILQLLASAENSVREELPLMDDEDIDSSPDALTAEVIEEYEEPVVTPEDEAALLHYVCEAEVDSYDGALEGFRAVEEWLLGVYYSWCEISAFMYTLVGSGAHVDSSDWSYRARFGCHCRLCLGLANNERPLRRLLRALVCALAHGGDSALAAHVVRALHLRPGTPRPCADWDLTRLRRLTVSAAGEAIIHEHLTKLAQQSDITEEVVTKICLCRTYDKPLEKEHAMERFCKLLENFKTVSTINFKVELVTGGAEGAGGASGWAGAVARFLAPHQRRPTAERLAHMAARTSPHDLSAWAGYKHRCDCLTPRTLCAQQRKQLLRISFFGMMQAMNEFNNTKGADEKAPIQVLPEGSGRELQQGEGTGAKPPDTTEQQVEPAHGSTPDLSDSNITAELDDLSDTGSTGASLGLSSSSLDSASELLVFAAAVEEGAEGGGLCRTVRHLMRSIASIERLMDRVLRHCDEWPAPHAHAPSRTDHEARKRVDMGLSEVDRKLMAMYRRLPEVHKRQLQVYRKQKKLSTVCAQLVGGSAPAPPAPASPPPAPASPPPAPAHAPCAALCPEYHLQRFKEVRRKVMHMRDQQLYYHRLRMWLEDQLRQERDKLKANFSVPDTNVTLVEDLPRRKRRTLSPKVPKAITAPKRKLKSAHVSQYISKPHKILQLLKHKAPALSETIKSPYKEIDDDSNVKSDAEPPEAFPLEKEDNISDTETIVGEKENDICKEMKDCLVKFANFALNAPDNAEPDAEAKYPESVSPPLQEMSPTTEPTPLFTQKPRILVNKILSRTNEKDDKVIDFNSQVAPDINVPFNARVPRVDTDGVIKTKETNDPKDPDAYKYMSFGMEIKKAMEECQNIIISYNKDEKELENEIDDNFSLEQIVEVIMSLDKNTTELLDKMDTDESMELNNANTKLAELVENMPQILANMPEIASKLSEFANASFELPEFASIMNSLPDVNNDAQLTPETLKQIRDLKLSKRDNVKVTKRKINRKVKNTENDVNTMTLEFDGKDITDLLKEDNELQVLMNHKNTKEDLMIKDLLFSISAQVVISKVFEYVKNNKTPELAKYFNNDKDLFSLPRNSIDPEMYNKASILFDNSVKDALSMQELRELVKSRFNSWKNYVASKFRSIPVEILDSEIEAMLDKFYAYIQVLASKQSGNDSDKIIERIDRLRKNKDGSESDSDGCAAAKESLKLITKILSISAGNTFDMLVMKLSKMSQDKKASVINLKFKYIDMVRRCSESQELIMWILLDPEIATNVIQELTGLEVREIDNLPDFSTMTNERKKDYFLNKLREMNKQFMQMLPKKALTGDEWLVMLYRLEQLEEKLKEALAKATTPPKVTQPTERHGASEAEILAAKGLSKIIGKSNFKVASKSNEPPKPVKKEPETEPPLPTTEKDDEKLKNNALLAKCEAILTSKGEKALLDSFYTIKSYITQGLPVPETYKKHVISICSSIDAKLLDEDIEQTLKARSEEQENADTDKDKNSATVVGSQNPEFLAKYSAQALRNAKQTLNVVAFRNLMRNGQSKSESDACDTPKSNCKWTNDCVCESCKDSDVSVCLGDIMKQWYDEEKTKNGLEEKKKEVKKHIQKVKPVPKMCENAVHPQHVCKAGHGTSMADEADGDQPCTCCYCTVFGHAPPLTTPVPRNFNETRERLRSILNKKKQKCKSNGEVENDKGTQPAPHQPHPVHPTHATAKPPALPKTLPPNLTSVAQKQALDTQHKQLADKMAKMAVSDKPDNRTQQNRAEPAQANAQAALRTDGRVNPNAMEQIRLQQLKQQQLQHMQHQLQQLQQQQHEHDAQHQQKPQNKPEPIYDLPIHNKPQLTPQQQQQIRQQQLQQQQQQLLRRQQMQQQQHQLQQQQIQQHQLQQQQLQQQQLQQRQARQQQNPVSLSSRDTSVFSTSSGCSGGSCWRGGRAEDPRDLDALLQYIEGPARHVDRGKKKAKKQRQKAKRTEARLLEQARALRAELAEGRRAAAALRDAHDAASSQVKTARHALAHTQPRARKKGKKQKLNPEQESNLQLLNKLLGDYIALVNTTAKELENVEKRVSECSQELQQVDRELAETRAILGPQADRENMPQNELLEAYMLTLGGCDMGVKAAVDRGVAALTELLRPDRLNALGLQTSKDKSAAQKAADKKQTWEQAVAHINQLAKGSQKEKKKQKEPEEKVESKPKPPPPPQKTKPVEEPPLTKKQRKLLAKQQAEEEEKRKQQAEKQKKEKKQPEPVKESKKDKKEQKSEPEGKKKKQEQKKENKKQEEKSKENKQDKNVQAKAKTKESNKKATPAPAAAPAAPSADKPASCSIMEQLSCGVQVADLRLPPGITLTRVQPAEKKEPAIKSVPLWKCGSLAATPTPPVRPPPVINADPSMLVFSTMPNAPPPRPAAPEPAPQPAGKSKKAKKRAKKAAAAEAEPAPDGPKMVTLRNPMFHPDLPAVQLAAPPVELRVPEPIPMPPAPCQATITPTSNGMYTIRNPLMSLVHRQNLRPPRPAPPPYEPDAYAPRADPDADFPSRIMNLASFTQKNDEGYSLFKTSDDSHQRSFLAPEYFEAPAPKVVSPNPIGTRPERYEPRPEPIGPPLRRDAGGGGALYTPFGAQDGVFRHAALRPEPAEPADTLPYFQRLRAGSKLNSEVTIHYVTDSKYYKGQDAQPEMPDESLFSRPQPAWSQHNCAAAGGVIGPPRARAAASPHHGPTLENHVYGERVMSEMCERDEYKRFDYFYEPPPHLDMAMRHTK